MRVNTLNTSYLLISAFILYVKCIVINTVKRPCVNYQTEKLVENLKSRGFFHSIVIEKVLCSIDRKEFTNDNNLYFESYIDNSIYIGYGASISPPYIHAYALELLHDKLIKLKQKKQIKILDVGSGSGYLLLAFAKLLDFLNFTNYEIYGVDHIEELVNFSILNISKSNSHYIRNRKIKVITGDGRKGLIQFKPFDFIHVGATSEVKPTALINQLSNEGRLFIPIKENYYNEYINIIDKMILGDIITKKTFSVQFMPLTDKSSQHNKYHNDEL